MLHAAAVTAAAEQDSMTTISMRHHALTAVFASSDEASRAHSALLEKGIDPREVATSIDFTQDGVAAEAPGQAYANQGDAPHSWRLFKWGIDFGVDADEARILGAVQRGSVVLTVDPVARSNRAIVMCILKEHRALAIWGKCRPSIVCQG